MSAAALALSVLIGAGAALLAWWWLATARCLAGRIAPYLPEARNGQLTTTASGWWRAAVSAFGRALGGRDNVARRLCAAGSSDSVADFRSSQLAWAAAGLTGGLALSVILARTRGTPLTTLLALTCGLTLAGAAARDWRLGRVIRRRREAMIAELPVVAELLALSVAAGDSIHGALTRIVTTCRGQVATDLSVVLAAVSAGSRLGDVLDERSRTCPLPPMAGLYDAIATALERGTPLTDVLHAQALDIREAGRRALLEVGGRKEIAMMVPVVFLILPVTVLFAVFPGFVSLSLLV